jgi:type I restriction enzyme R subunit
LAVPHEKAMAIRDEVGFFQIVRSAILKMEPHGGGPTDEDYDLAIKQIVSSAITSETVVDIIRPLVLKHPKSRFFKRIFGRSKKLRA